MPEVLVELLEHMQHDRSIRRIAAEQELSTTVIAALTSLETIEMAHGSLDRPGDERLEFDERSDSAEL